MLKAIIFDFDGIVVDTEKNKFNFLKSELKKHGYNLNNNDFPKIIGKKTVNALKELFPTISKEIMEQIIIQRTEVLNKSLLHITPINGLENLLVFLNKKYIIALSTGTKRKLANDYLKKHSLINYFNILVTGDDFKSSKPDPEGFILTLKKLNCKPSEVIIIEDSQPGIISAKKAGCKVFALKMSYNKDQITGADKIFKNYKDMLEYFKSLP